MEQYRNVVDETYFKALETTTKEYHDKLEVIRNKWIKGVLNETK